MLTKNQAITLINTLVSIALIIFILYSVGIEEVIFHIAGVDLFLLFLSVVALLGMYGGMVVRVRMLLHELHIPASFAAVTRSHFIGMLLADFTPARTGYFATAASLHYNYKVPSEKALVSIFGPQIFDFALKVIAGTAGVLLLISRFLKPGEGHILYIAAAGIFSLVVVMLLVLFSSRFLRLFIFTTRFPIVGKIAQRAINLFSRMQESSHVVVKKTPQLLAILLFTWSAKAISWYFVAKSLGITIQGIDFPEIFFYFFFQPLITMLEFLPSPTIAGVGLSEGGTALVMSLFGVPPALGTSFALLARIKTTVVNLVAVPDTVRILPKAFEDGMKGH